MRLLCEHNGISSLAATSLGVEVLRGISLIKMHTSPVHQHSLALPNLILCSFKLDPLDTHTRTLSHTLTLTQMINEHCMKKNKSSNFNLPQYSLHPISLPALVPVTLISPSPSVDSHRIY